MQVRPKGTRHLAVAAACEQLLHTYTQACSLPHCQLKHVLERKVREECDTGHLGHALCAAFTFVFAMEVQELGMEHWTLPTPGKHSILSYSLGSQLSKLMGGGKNKVGKRRADKESGFYTYIRSKTELNIIKPLLDYMLRHFNIIPPKS